MRPATAPQPSAQIPALDGLRAVAITIVFASHAGVSHLIPGGFGVTLFFFLSGFLITTLLSRELQRSGTIAIGPFYMRRLLRLMPALLVVLAIGFLLVKLGLATGTLAPDTVLSQLFFFYNYHSLTPGFFESVEGFSIFWSLSVEEHFYLIWPALFLWLGQRRGQVGWVCALLVLALLWRWVRFALLNSSEWAIYISSDTRMDAILYGCLLAILMQQDALSRVFRPGWSMYLWLGAALGLLLVSFALRDPLFRATLRYSLQGLALMPLFYYAIARPKHPCFRMLNHPALRQIGVWSYGIYLLHFLIIGALAHSGFAPLGSWQMLGAAAALSITGAALIHHLIERPLMPLRHRFAAGAAPAALPIKQTAHARP